jgi:L-seryl-tRNA(Ser) seleniumtransferase
MRPDKVTLAALQAVLQLYTNPNRLAEDLPALRLLTRDSADIKEMAHRLLEPVQELCKPFKISVARTQSQVGSGALPVDRLESAALKITRPDLRRSGAILNRLAKGFRGLPVPVIGRIADDALWFDLRCLEDEEGFVANLAGLVLS